MAQTYLDVINFARGELGKSDLPLSRLVDTDVEARKGRSALQRALKDLLTKHLLIPTENFIAEVETLDTVSKLTNLTTDPWDCKMVRELHYLDETENVRRRISPITEAQAKDFALKEFAETYPQFYYQKGNDLYVLPVPNGVYKIQLRYSRVIPILALEDLTSEISIDGEGFLVLQDLTQAYLQAGVDPEWQTYLGLARESAEVYYKRLNYGLKNQGVRSTMKVRTNTADRSF